MSAFSGLRLSGIAIGIYPILAHIGLWTESPRVVVGYLLGLLLIILLYPPRYKQVKNTSAAVLLLVTIVVLANNELDYILIYVPPVIIPLMLFFVFIQSLGSDQIPVITQFEQKMNVDELDVTQVEYTRRVTYVWVIVFAFMIIEALLLTFFASMELWSWFTHVANYGLIALVIVVEFIYRKYRFKQNDTGFKQFVIALSKHRWK